jgi:polysaccharide export outer membrane protein
MRYQRRILAFAAALAAIGGGCSSSGSNLAPLPVSGATQEYRLAAGDKIRLQVYGLDSFNNDYVVGDSGMLSLPMIGSIPVAGMTLAEVEQNIERGLAERQILREPVVNAQHVLLRPFYIMGEVRNPGEYAYRPGTTVMSAVALAGGFTYRASSRSVAVTRTINGREVTGSATQQTKVEPGDRIHVFEKWF